MRLVAWAILAINLALLTQQLRGEAGEGGVLLYSALVLVLVLLITS